MKLTLFFYVWSDTALGGRVDGEYAGVCTASHVPVHPASAFIDGLLEDLCFPAVHKRGIEAVPCSIAVGKHERLLGVQRMLCEGVEFGGVPVNLDLDLGKGHRVRRIGTLSIGREGDVGLVVIGVRVLWGAQLNTCQDMSHKDTHLSVPTARKRLSDVSSFPWIKPLMERTTWDRSPPGHWRVGRVS